MSYQLCLRLHMPQDICQLIGDFGVPFAYKSPEKDKNRQHPVFVTVFYSVEKCLNEGGLVGLVGGEEREHGGGCDLALQEELLIQIPMQIYSNIAQITTFLIRHKLKAPIH